eukprot:m.39848 g.39848  ORF g.39848 m.39848 type:complete len:161 (+) comp32838_c0_seq1:59-541(+)
MAAGSSFTPGDEISVPTEKSRVASHHGIYVGGPGDYVIHFSGFDPKSARIKKDTLEDFAQGRPISKVSCSSWNCRSNEETVGMAEKLLANAEEYPAYDLLKNNCEHFTQLCKTGTKKSGQADLVHLLVDQGSRMFFNDPDAADGASALVKAGLSYFSSSS